MKAQLSFEYYISLIIFIVFVTYLFFQLLNYAPNYFNEVKLQRLRSEAYQISELLVNDAGYPDTWDSGDAKRLGLLDQSQNKINFLSWNKITKFNDMCKSSYISIRNLLGAEDNLKILLVDKNTQSSLIDCSAPDNPGRNRADIRRTVAYRNSFGGLSFGELTVQAW